MAAKKKPQQTHLLRHTTILLILPIRTYTQVPRVTSNKCYENLLSGGADCKFS